MLPVSGVSFKSAMPNVQQKSPSVVQQSKGDSVHFGNRMSELTEFVNKHTQIVSAKETGNGIVNMVILGVKKVGNPSLDEFSKLAEPVKEMMKNVKNGELSFLPISREMKFDRNSALKTMGLGEMLGAWKVKTPADFAPMVTKDWQSNLANGGMVYIKNS